MKHNLKNASLKIKKKAAIVYTLKYNEEKNVDISLVKCIKRP